MYRLVRIFFSCLNTLIFIVALQSSIFANKLESIAQPMTHDTTLCAPSFIVLKAYGSSGRYQWYTSSQGLGQLINSSVFVSVTTTFYVSAIKIVEGRVVESNRVPLNVNINPSNVSDPSVDTLKICTDGQSYIFAKGAGKDEYYKWYSDSSSSPLKISTSAEDNFYTLFVSSSTKLYVSIASKKSSCESRKLLVPIQQLPKPTNPVVIKNPVRCGDGFARYEVENDSKASFKWYPCKNGCGSFDFTSEGEPNTGNFFDMYLQNPGGIYSYTLWVEKVDNKSACTSNRVPITATSYQVPSPIVPKEVYGCRKEVKTISASIPLGQTESAVLLWYEDVQKTKLLHIGSTFDYTAKYKSDKTIYVTVKDAGFNNCESNPLQGAVDIHPNSNPNAPQVMSSDRCGETQFYVIGSNSSFQYRWYTTDTIHEIAVGENFLNFENNIYGTSTFFVSAFSQEGCNSNLTKVVGSPKSIPAAPSINPVSRCGFGNVKLSVSGAGKFTTYHWYDDRDARIPGEINSEYTTPYLIETKEFHVAYVGANGCESEKASVSAIVKQGVSLNTSAESICPGNSVYLIANGGRIYRWSENGIIFSSRSTIYVNPFVSTTYTVTDPTIYGECNSATVTIQVKKSTECEALDIGSTSTSESKELSALHKGEPSINVFPNPMVNEFWIQTSLTEGKGTIYDITGTVVCSFSLASVLNQPLPFELKSGHYWVEVVSNGTVFRQKLLKL